MSRPASAKIEPTVRMPQWQIGWRLETLLAGLLFSSIVFATIHLEGCSSRRDEAVLVEASERASVIRAGELHTYRVDLREGDYLNVTIDLQDVGAEVVLNRPDNTSAATATGGSAPLGRLTLAWIADLSSLYTLQVEGKRAEVAIGGRPDRGRYRLVITHLHQANEEEHAHYTRRHADDLYAEGERLSVRPEAAARRKAIASYAHALPLARQLGDRGLEALILNSIGLVHFNLGEITEAMNFYRPALDLYRELGDRFGEADIIFSMGQALLEQGDAEHAIVLIRQAIDSCREIGNETTQARALVSLGMAERSLGNGLAAQQSFLTSLEISRKIGDKEKEATARTGLGLVQMRRGELQAANTNLQAAYAYYTGVNDTTSLALLLSNLGLLSSYRGDQESALAYFERCLKIGRSVSDRKIEALAVNNIGYLREKLGEHDRALESYRIALELFRTLGDRSSEATALENVARAHSALGQGETAIKLLGEALEIRLSTGNLPGQAYALESLGIVKTREGKPIEARSFFEKSLQIARKIGDRRVEAVSLRGMAQADLALSNPERALRFSEDSLRVTEMVRGNVADQDLRSTFLASTREFYELQVEILMELEKRHPGNGNAARALQASETARARSLLELLSEANVDVRQGISPGLKELERNNRDRLSKLQTQLIAQRAKNEPDRAKITGLEEDLRQGEEERLQLEEKIRTHHPRYASLQYPSPLGVADIQPHLDADTALLEYALSKETSYLFVLTREGLTTYTLPGEAELAPQVQTLREILIRPGRREFGRYKQLGFSLYQTLLAPAENEIAQKSRLIIVPDGILTYLAFESLLTGVSSEQSFGDLPYLLDRWAVSYVPSATVLVSLATKPEHPVTASAVDGATQFFGVGDPVYNAPDTAPTENQTAPELGWEPLRGLFGSDGKARLVRLEDSAREVREAAEIFGPAASKLLIGKDASEENVKRSPELRHARYLHFATHGLISERNPQYSGLVLNLDDDPAEDGLFQVYEIFDLEIDADLVVLSACRSGLGKDVRGEGLVGLTRAFFYAGAPSVVVSLWPVADRSTADLMVSFYRHLQNGDGKTEALRQAKLELRRGGRFQHPYYWAPFVLTGRP